MYNILIFYYCKTVLRPTLFEHLNCFHKYSNHRCFYFNLAFGKPQWYLKKVHFDLIIFHTILLNYSISSGSQRSSLYINKDKFKQALTKVNYLKNDLKSIKIAIPQDEFVNTEILCDFINEFNIDYVFSAAPESEWPILYNKVNLKKVKFCQVLTGYIDPFTVEKINTIAKKEKRIIDIGYRSRHSAPWLGKHGLLKPRIAEVFLKNSPQHGLSVDISTKDEDAFLGDNWYKFLLRCKYTLGVEGGSSMIHRDRKIVDKIEDYIELHPQASIQEIENECDLQDNSVNYFAISPRHLEACITKTCQILIEGKYNDILIPGKHYIELKQDFSNLNEVLNVVKQDTKRQKIVEEAYRDIVESNLYTYQRFVEEILRISIHQNVNNNPSYLNIIALHLLYLWMRLVNHLTWPRILLHGYLVGPILRKAKPIVIKTIYTQTIFRDKLEYLISWVRKIG